MSDVVVTGTVASLTPGKTYAKITQVELKDIVKYYIHTYMYIVK